MNIDTVIWRLRVLQTKVVGNFPLCPGATFPECCSRLRSGTTAISPHPSQANACPIWCYMKRSWGASMDPRKMEPCWVALLSREGAAFISDRRLQFVLETSSLPLVVTWEPSFVLH